MKYIVTINGKNYEVEVERGQATIVKTTVATPAPPVAPTAPVAPAAPVAAQPTVNVGSGEAVKAPMPGTILDVKVTPGTSVKKGAVLFILEAMKMENEVVAPRDGVVANVVVAKGASVATGDILAVLQ